MKNILLRKLRDVKWTSSFLLLACNNNPKKAENQRALVADRGEVEPVQNMLALMVQNTSDCSPSLPTNAGEVEPVQNISIVLYQIYHGMLELMGSWPYGAIGAFRRSPSREAMALFSFQKFYKIFQIFRHIKSLDVCMEY